MVIGEQEIEGDKDTTTRLFRHPNLPIFGSLIDAECVYLKKRPASEPDNLEYSTQPTADRANNSNSTRQPQPGAVYAMVHVQLRPAFLSQVYWMTGLTGSGDLRHAAVANADDSPSSDTDNSAAVA